MSSFISFFRILSLISQHFTLPLRIVAPLLPLPPLPPFGRLARSRGGPWLLGIGFDQLRLLRDQDESSWGRVMEVGGVDAEREEPLGMGTCHGIMAWIMAWMAWIMAVSKVNAMLCLKVKIDVKVIHGVLGCLWVGLEPANSASSLCVNSSASTIWDHFFHIFFHTFCTSSSYCQGPCTPSWYRYGCILHCWQLGHLAQKRHSGLCMKARRETPCQSVTYLRHLNAWGHGYTAVTATIGSSGQPNIWSLEDSEEKIVDDLGSKWRSERKWSGHWRQSQLRPTIGNHRQPGNSNLY